MKNTLYLIIADLASKGVGGLLGLVLARFLGVVDYGKYAIAIAICSLFLLLTAVGLEQELTRRGGLDDKAVHGALKLNMVCLMGLTLAAYLLMGLFLFLSDYSVEVRTLTLVAGAALIVARFHLPFRSFWLTRKNILPVALAQSLGTFFILIGTLLILYYDGSVLGILLLQGVIAALVLVFYVKSLPVNEHPSQAVSSDRVYRFLKDSIPFGLSSMIWIAYFNFDVVMLSLFESEKEVGLYGGLYRIMAVSYIIGYAISNSYTPRLYELYDEAGLASFITLGKKLMLVLSFAGLTFGISLFIWADTIISVILGSQYIEGSAVLRILSISAIFRFMNFGLCEIMTTAGHQNRRVRFEFGMLFVNLCGNAILIPVYGTAGAALATLAAELVLLVLVCVFLSRHIILPAGRQNQSQ